MKIVVTVEGGVIQDVLASHPGVEVIIVDLDADQYDEAHEGRDLSPEDGSECIITRQHPKVDPRLEQRFEGKGILVEDIS